MSRRPPLPAADHAPIGKTRSPCEPVLPAQGAGDPRHRPHVALPGGARSGRGRGSQPESPSVTCAGSAQMSRMDPRCETAGGAGSSCGRDTRIPRRGRSAADERLRNGRVAGTPRRAGPSSIGRSSRSGVPAVLRRAASASARRLGPPPATCAAITDRSVRVV